MKYKLSMSITLVVITMFLGCHNIPGKHTEQPYLIVLSLDGFRWDYPEKAYTPTLDSLANAGSRAESIIPCFPTKTFPNHY
ncbi:MAG: alkaline phosphatase family protein, partial [Bacteroidales bacterium]|nr:alkaline phosphatase family protein [Bacteroidales bacterium]